jgi:hypothetical protein
MAACPQTYYSFWSMQLQHMLHDVVVSCVYRIVTDETEAFCFVLCCVVRCGELRVGMLS